MNTYSHFVTNITNAVVFYHTSCSCTSLSLTCYPRRFLLFSVLIVSSCVRMFFVLFSHVASDSLDVTCFSFTPLPAGGGDPYCLLYLVANMSNGLRQPRDDVGQSVWCVVTECRT
jgi:hypothetical protein